MIHNKIDIVLLDLQGHGLYIKDLLANNLISKEDYNLLTNNCTTAVQRTMDAVGLKTTSSILIPLGRIPKNPNPKASFKYIKRNNPDGLSIQRIKER